MKEFQGAKSNQKKFSGKVKKKDCKLWISIGCWGLACVFLLLGEGLVNVSQAVLQPREVLVLANKKAGRSVGLARYYMHKRGIPEDNLLVLWVPERDWCTRKEYEKSILGPVQRRVAKKGKQIRCLVLFYGLPLKVLGPPAKVQEKRTLVRLEGEEEALKQDKHKNATVKVRLEQVRQALVKLRQKMNRSAALDSELALARVRSYPLDWWIVNPYFLGARSFKGKLISKADVLMVSRLDGPDPQTVKRIIDDSLDAEKNGLPGKAYFDARWADNPAARSGYGLYDHSLHLAAAFLEQAKNIPVVLEESGQLFQPGQCPQAALYCGWYSLSHYVDAFTWVRGAVAYHIASGECVTLRGQTQGWCKGLLEDGVAATLGPVEEPYVQAFPLPELFFKILSDGFWSLAETYLLSNPFWSWKMVLIGDPMYRPFKNKGLQSH